MDNLTTVTNHTHNEEITEFLTSDSHLVMSYLGFEAGSALINQMGGDEVFLQAFKNKSEVSDLKKLTGLDDSAELQSIYTKHKDALLSAVSRHCLGDTLVSIHDHSHTHHHNNNLPCGVTFSIEETAQGLYSPAIVDNTADHQFLEAGRYVCRRVIVGMLNIYDGFTRQNNEVKDVENLLNVPVKLAGYDIYMPSNIASDLTQLLGGIKRLLAESENLNDSWLSTEFYDEPLVLSNHASVLPVFERNKEAILTLISEIATENNFTSAFALIDQRMLGAAYNPDMVAEAYWSDTKHTGASESLSNKVAIGVVSFVALMLCRTVNAYQVGIDA